MKRLFAVAALALLAGCTALQQRAQAKLNAQDDAQCQNMGAVPGTDRYYDCRITLVRMRAQRDAEINAGAAAMGAAGLGLLSQPQGATTVTNCIPTAGMAGGLNCASTTP